MVFNDLNRNQYWYSAALWTWISALICCCNLECDAMEPFFMIDGGTGELSSEIVDSKVLSCKVGISVGTGGGHSEGVDHVCVGT